MGEETRWVILSSKGKRRDRSILPSIVGSHFHISSNSNYLNYRLIQVSSKSVEVCTSLSPRRERVRVRGSS